MENNNMDNEDVIRIGDLLHTIFKHRKLLVMTSLAGLVIGIILSVISYMRGEMAKQYVVKTSIAVTSQTPDGLFTTQKINPDTTDIHLAEDMVDSVIYVMKSDRTLEATVEKLQLVGISTRDIYNNLELSQYNQTQIVDISLYWRNAEEGVQILNALNEVAPKVLADVLKIGDVSVVNYPNARYLIGGQVNASMWIIMMAAGLGVGVMISLLYFFLRPTLVNSADVSEQLGLELLGEMPRDPEYTKGKKKRGRETFIDHYVSAAQILINHTAKQQSSERASQMNVFRGSGRKAHILYAASAGAFEGRTSVVANLGQQLANLERKVLLVDLDHHAPGLGKMLLQDVSYERSINAVYHGDCDVRQAIVPINGYLDVLPAILERKEITLEETLLQAICSLSGEYDYILIDAAPVGQNADTLTLGRFADAALFVIRYDHAPIAKIKGALNRLKQSGTPIAGCIVNQR